MNKLFFGAALQGVAFFISVGCFSANAISPSRGWVFGAALAAISLGILYAQEFKSLEAWARAQVVIGFVLVAIVGGLISAS